MKAAGLILVGLGTTLTILYLTVGGHWLAIGLGAVSVTLLIVSVFTLGVWYAHKSIGLGAKLVIEAQTSNDQWDTAKIKSLTHFGTEMLKLKGDNNNGGYPPLLESGNDFNFTINGLEDE